MALTVAEINHRYNQAVEAANAAHAEITDDTPDSRRTELQERFDRHMADADALLEQRQTAMRLDEHNRRREENDREQREREDHEQRQGRGRPRQDQPDGRENDDGEMTHDQAFDQLLRSKARPMSQRALEVLTRHDGMSGVDLEERALGTDAGATGGHLVPDGFANRLYEFQKAYGPMMDRDIGTMPMDTSTGEIIDYPINDDTANQGNLTAENAALSNDGSEDPSFGNVQISSYIITSGIVKASLKMLRDSRIDIEGFLTEAFGKRLGRKGSAFLTTGTGSGQPQGIVTGAGPASFEPAAVDAITGDELIDFQHEIDAAYRASPGCIWQFNDDTLKAIRKLKDGDNNYLWTRGDIQNGAPAEILGHRYRVNYAMASLAASARAIIFGDHSAYVVRRVGDVSVAVLDQVFMPNLQQGFLAYQEIDGRLLDSTAVKALVMPAS